MNSFSITLLAQALLFLWKFTQDVEKAEALRDFFALLFTRKCSGHIAQVADSN